MPELTVGAGLARGLVDLAVAKGADRRALLARAGIDAELLKDQDNRVPAAAYTPGRERHGIARWRGLQNWFNAGQQRDRSDIRTGGGGLGCHNHDRLPRLQIRDLLSRQTTQHL